MNKRVDTIHKLSLRFTTTGYICEVWTDLGNYSSTTRAGDDMTGIRDIFISFTGGGLSSLSVDPSHEPETRRPIPRHFSLSLLAGCSMVKSLVIYDGIVLDDLVGIEELPALVSLVIMTPLVSLTGIEYAQNLESLDLDYFPRHLEMISGLGIKELAISECSQENEELLVRIMLELPCLEKLFIPEYMIDLLQGLTSPVIKTLTICFPAIDSDEADKVYENIEQKMLDENPALSLFMSKYPTKTISSKTTYLMGDFYGTVIPKLKFRFNSRDA